MFPKALPTDRESLETVQKLVFDGITALCLSPFGFPGGKEHKETALNGRSYSAGRTGVAGKTG